MLYIFDFDYTLFDTTRFKRDLAGNLGLSYEDFCIIYNKHFAKQKMHYDIAEHLRIIEEERQLCFRDFKKLLEKVVKHFSSCPSYLYPEALPALENLKSQEHSLHLVSFGNRDYQKYKIENSGIKKYFDRIRITEDPKEKDINGWEPDKHDTVIIVNDNAREAIQMREMLGRGTIFLLQGPYSHNIKHDFAIHTLSDLLGY